MRAIINEFAVATADVLVAVTAGIIGLGFILVLQ